MALFGRPQDEADGDKETAARLWRKGPTIPVSVGNLVVDKMIWSWACILSSRLAFLVEIFNAQMGSEGYCRPLRPELYEDPMKHECVKIFEAR